MVPSAPVNPRDSRLARILVLLAIVLGLATGAAACSSGDAEVVGVVETTTTVAPDPYVTVVATATTPEIEVLDERPPDATSDRTTPPTTTPSEADAVQPIPRVGLASAGSAKTDTGWSFENPTYFDNPLAMVVTESAGDWLRVMLPARPNGMEGWVRAGDVELTSHSYRMELNLAEFDLKVYDGEELIEQTGVVIGKDATPTPVGIYYLNEMIPQSNPGGAFGPWILSTSAYSETLETFDGGLPVIAFHGTNQPDLIGTQASNGCIRMPNDVVTRLAETLPAGTPVTVVAG